MQDRARPELGFMDAVLARDLAPGSERCGGKDQALECSCPVDKPPHAGRSGCGARCRKNKDFVSSEAAT